MGETRIVTPRSDDYIKNMIRRMLVEEGWTRAEPRRQLKIDTISCLTEDELQAILNPAKQAPHA
jgi:hypothetical protein